ncbi:PREDICTED: uncharacterized protein LOC104702464 [Camelina sativa]|uniref:Uncharacterized protein LOC104702464 n=1 Tax=Camelina sativa TaxID=90675 RepID=A0ABM0SV81_CAMSA|nr:PREDICTED: uncharacterized protein LOC104702464 [Camelina sativa]
MEIIPLMPIAFIILVSSFPAPIKVAGKGGGGGGRVAGGGSGSIGFGRSGNTGRGGVIGDESTVGIGYRGGTAKNPKPAGGGDPGASIVVIPKQPEEKKAYPMPPECKTEVQDCIRAHIHGEAKAPKYRGPCCVKLNTSVACVCKFLKSHDHKLRKGANDVLRGCNFNKTKCSKVPMPQVCTQEAKHCIHSHIYGGLGAPQHGGACCQKFKYSKKCVCTFVKSNDPHLSRKSKGVIQGCHFNNANCQIKI